MTLDHLQQDLADFGFVMSHYNDLSEMDRRFMDRHKHDLVNLRIPFHRAERTVLFSIIEALDVIHHDYYSHD